MGGAPAVCVSGSPGPRSPSPPGIQLAQAESQSPPRSGAERADRRSARRGRTDLAARTARGLSRPGPRRPSRSHGGRSRHRRTPWWVPAIPQVVRRMRRRVVIGGEQTRPGILRVDAGCCRRAAGTAVRDVRSALCARRRCRPAFGRAHGPPRHRRRPCTQLHDGTRGCEAATEPSIRSSAVVGPGAQVSAHQHQQRHQQGTMLQPAARICPVRCSCSRSRTRAGRDAGVNTTRAADWTATRSPDRRDPSGTGRSPPRAREGRDPARPHRGGSAHGSSMPGRATARTSWRQSA